MEERSDLTPTALAKLVGISTPYASQLLSGTRSPARPLALQIFVKAGLKLGALANLTDADAATVARIESEQVPA